MLKACAMTYGRWFKMTSPPSKVIPCHSTLSKRSSSFRFRPELQLGKFATAAEQRIAWSLSSAVVASQVQCWQMQPETLQVGLPCSCWAQRGDPHRETQNGSPPCQYHQSTSIVDGPWWLIMVVGPYFFSGQKVRICSHPFLSLGR